MQRARGEAYGVPGHGNTAEARHVARRSGTAHNYAHGLNVTVGTVAASPRHPDLGHPRRPASSLPCVSTADRSSLLRGCPADTLWRASTPVVGPGGGVEWSKRLSGATRWGGKGLSAASRRHEIRSERQCAGLDELYAAYTETTSPHVPPRPPLGFPCALLSSRPHWSLCICADR